LFVMLATAMVAGLMVGWLRGGTFAALGGFTPRIPWVIPLAFAGQYLMVRATGDDVVWWVLPLHMSAYALLLAGIVANRDVPGAPLLTVGLALNALAIGANGGLMPLAPEHFALNHAGVQIELGQHVPATKSVLLPREETRFLPLTDVLALPEGLPRRGMFSLGDVAIVLGVGWAIQGLMHRSPHQDHREHTQHTEHQVNTAGPYAGVGENVMAINMESAQLVIGAAALDARFRKLLLTNPDRALREVTARPGVPSGSRVSEDDRRVLATIRAGSLSEFARGVERLRTGARG
jgi:hypothetical protein